MKVIAVLFSVFAISSAVLCQTDPKIELFGGYSYLRGHDFLETANFNGWNASATYGFNRWMGLTADFSGHYQPGGVLNRHAFLIGPNFKLTPPDSRTSLFSHALVGAVHTGSFASPLRGTSFGTALGGGMDVGMTKALGLRVLQADYLGYRTHTGVLCADFFPPCPGPQTHWTNNFRASTGIVLRFGKPGQ